METHDDKTFEELVFAGTPARNIEYNNCTFKKCDFTNSEFMHCKFIDCVFDNCNLSMMKWTRSTMSNLVFRQCKILGVNFSLCEDFLFSVRFEASILDYCSFMGKKMLKTWFIKSSLKEATFSQANIAGSVFDQCDLSGTVFSQTDLTSVNFSTALHYTLDPELNHINKAIFSADGLPGLLSKYQIKIV